MRKRISVEQLRLGMYIHEFCGSWMDHPFLRGRFKLDDAGDLKRIHASGLKEVWIDTDRGLDVAFEKPDEGLSEAEIQAQIEMELALAVQEPVAVLTSDARVVPAAHVVTHAREQVQSLFTEARMGRAIDVESCGPVVDDVMDSIERHRDTLLTLVRLKSADEYTYLHSVAVCALMVALAKTLKLPTERVREAGLAGLLHDMGKAVIPLEVLNKPGRLTDEEFALMKSHPAAGHNILVRSSVTDGMALDVCLHHHEKMDGSGYPKGLKADAISLYARMGAVCDVYDAVTSDRPYKKAWDPGEAVRQMAQWKGHFDPAIFQAFVKTVGIYPTGTLVRLKSDRLAVVLAQHDQLLLPRVKVFYSIKSNEHVEHRVVDLAAPACEDRIAGVESPEKWNFQNLERLWLDEVKAAGG